MFTITSFFAYIRTKIGSQVTTRFTSVLLFTFVPSRVQGPTRLRYLFLVIGHISYLRVQGGSWALLTGGMFAVYGPFAELSRENNYDRRASHGPAYPYMICRPSTQMETDRSPVTFCMSIVGVSLLLARRFLG